MNLSEHFTLQELTYSETAIRKGIDNTPTPEIFNNLQLLCMLILEPIRMQLAIPIRINSGYRSIEVNKLVGGVSTSQHCKGQAADMVAIGLTIDQFYEKIKEMVANGLIVDQVIHEYNSWIHISYTNTGINRKQFLIKS